MEVKKGMSGIQEIPRMSLSATMFYDKVNGKLQWSN